MRSITALLIAAVLAFACQQQETPAPPPSATTTTETTDTTASAPAPPQWTRAELGAALNVDSSVPAGHSSIAVGKDNLPVVAWHEREPVYVKKWDGSAWQALGGRLNGGAGTFPTVIVRADGALVCAWKDWDGTKHDVRVASWNGSSWPPLGDAASTADVVHYRLADSTAGPAVAALERAAGGEPQLFVRRWNGSTWQQLGGGALNAVAGGTITHPPAIAAAREGDLAVAWIERAGTGGATTLHIRRWSHAENRWIEMPSPGNVDGDSRIDMSADAAGNLVLARTWNAGLRPYAVYENSSWKEVGWPDPKMEGGGGMPATLVAPAPSGFATLTWWQGALQLAQFASGQWTIVAPSVNAESHKGWDPGLATAANGTMYVSWIDTRKEPALLMAASYRRP